MIRISRVDVLGDHRVSLTFTDGLSGALDLSDLFGETMVAALVAEGACEDIGVGPKGSLKFGNGMRLSAESVYFAVFQKPSGLQPMPTTDPEHRHEATVRFGENFALLYEVTNQLSKSETFDDLCKNAIELGRTRLGFSRLGLWFVQDADHLTGSYGTSETGETVDERGISVSMNETLSELIRDGKYLLHYPQTSLYNGHLAQVGSGASATAPLWDGEVVLGTLHADDLLAPGSLTQEKAEMLALYAVTLAHLCSRKRVEDTAVHLNGALRALHEVSNELSRAQTLEELCRQAVVLGHERLDFPRLSIWLIDGPCDDCSQINPAVRGTYGITPAGDLIDERDRYLQDDVILGTMIREGSRHFYKTEDELFDSDRNLVGAGSHAVSLLWDGSRVMGAICADDLLTPGSLTESQAEILALYAVTVGHLYSRKRNEEAAITLSGQLTALHEVANELSRASTFDDLCRKAVELGRSKLGFSRLGMWFFDEPFDTTMHGSFGTSVTGETIDEREIHIAVGDMLKECLTNKERLQYMPGAQLFGSCGDHVGAGVRARALLWDGEVAIGTIEADDLLNPGSFTPQKVELLSLYSTTVGHLCSRKRAEETAARFSQRLAALHEVSNDLSRALTFNDLCRQAVELGRSRLGFSRMSMWFLDEKSGTLHGMYGTSETGETRDERQFSFLLDETFQSIIQDKRRLRYVARARLQDGQGGGVGEGAHAVALLWNGEIAIGAISADDLLSPGSLNEEQAELLAQYAATLGHLCSRKRGEESAAHFSNQLTNLHEVSNELALVDTSDDLCRLAVELGRSRLGFSRLGIWFLEPSWESGVGVKTLLRGSFGTSDSGETTDERAIRLPFSGALEEVVQGRRRLSYDVNQHLDNGHVHQVGTGTQAIAPLWDGSEIIGAVCADDLLDPGSLTVEQGELLALYAATIAHLYSRKRVEEATAHFSRQLTTLHEVSNELARVATSDELCRYAVEFGRSRLGFPRLSIWFLESSNDGRSRKTFLRGSYGTSPAGETTDERAIHHPFSGALEEVVHGRLRVSYDPCQRLDDGEVHPVGSGAHAIAPLWDGSEIIGSVCADDLLCPGALTAEQAEVLALYSATIGHLYSRKRAEEATAHFSQQLTTLHEVSNELARTNSSDELCRQAVEYGRSRLGFSRLSIWFLEPSRIDGEVRTLLRGSYGTSDTGETTDEREIRHPFSGALEEVVQGRRRLSYDVGQQLDDGNVYHVGVGTHAIAPLWDGSEIVGAICADDLLAPGSLTVEQGEVLALYAATIGHLYSRKKAEEVAAHFSEQLTTLHQVSNELSRTRTFDELCRKAVELGRSRLGFSRLGMWFLEGPDQIRGSFGTSDTGEITDERHVLLPSGDISDALAHGGKRVYYSCDTTLRDGYHHDLSVGAHAAAALWDGEVVVGSISADDLLDPGSLTDTQAEILALYAATLGHFCSRRRAEEATARFSQQLATLHEVSNVLSRSQTFDELCRKAVELGRSRLGFSRLGIWFIEGPDLIRGSYGTSDTGETTDERHILLPSGDISGDLARGGKRVFYSDKAQLRDGAHDVLAIGAHAAAALWDGEVVVGSITADDLLKPGSLTEAQIEILALYAATLGHLCSRKRAEEATARFSRQLAALHEVSNELSVADSLDDLCRLAVELGRTRLGFARVSMWFMDGASANVIRGSFGTSTSGETVDERDMRHPVCDSFVQVVREGKRMSYEKSVPMLDGEGNEVGYGTRAMALMWDGSEVIGSMAADDLLAPGTLTEEQAEILALYAATVAHLCSSKMAEQKRLNLERQVQHAQKLESLGVLAGGIAHDFNNILMAVLGYADLALQDLSQMHPAHASVSEIEKGAKRAAQLAKQMLAYSGKGRFIIDKIDLSGLMDDIAHLLRTSIARTITLNMSLDRSLPKIEADAAQMQQVVMNLITNAAEAIGDTVGSISLSTGQIPCAEEYLAQSLIAPSSHDNAPPPGQYVYFEVSDTGCGMDEDTTSRIFEPFFTTKFTGRGLGMAAVLGIVRSHKGAIMLDTTPGTGTTFRILFPAVKTKGEPEVVQKSDEPKPAEVTPRSATILVVDDEEVLRKLTKTVLERQGFKVLTAADGYEGVQAFREHAEEIDCVLLDLTMPNMDGELCFAELRRIRSDVKVILSSGYSEQEATQRFIGKDLAGFIQKPYQPGALNARIHEVLG